MNLLAELRVRKAQIKNRFIRVTALRSSCFVSLSADFLERQGYKKEWFTSGELMLANKDFKRLMSVYYKGGH